MKLSPIHRRDFIRKLRNLGWDGPFPGAKHAYVRKSTPTGTLKLPIPNPHGSGEISVLKLREILREIGVTPEEWINA
jgi:hypothetical protein